VDTGAANRLWVCHGATMHLDPSTRLLACAVVLLSVWPRPGRCRAGDGAALGSGRSHRTAPIRQGGPRQLRARLRLLRPPPRFGPGPERAANRLSHQSRGESRRPGSDSIRRTGSPPALLTTSPSTAGSCGSTAGCGSTLRLFSTAHASSTRASPRPSGSLPSARASSSPRAQRRQVANT
jgi:hypothetical protein